MIKAELKPLRNLADYQAALTAIEALWSAPAGRPVGHMGYHRRVRYLDVVTDKERIDGERGKSLNALAEQVQALKMR